MRRREHYWCLYHIKENNQLNDLRTDQIEAIFAAIPASQRPEWLIWKEGFPEWKPLSDFPQLLVALRGIPAESVQPPSPLAHAGTGRVSGSQTLVTENPDDNDPTLELTLDEYSNSDVREDVRYKKRFEVRILVEDRMYSNNTVNISLRGMQLESPLPEGLPTYFNLEIRGSQRSIPLVCSLVKTGQETDKPRLKIEANDHVAALHAMLLAG